MSWPHHQLSPVRALLGRFVRKAINAPPTALALLLTVFSASAQDSGGFYQPLTLALADHTTKGGGNGSAAPKTKHEIDYEDPQVKAAISEAMDNPISELLILWNQFDAVQVHFPGRSLLHERDEWAYKYQFMPTIPVPLGEHWNWVSRVNLSVSSVPLKKEVGELFQLDPVGNPVPDRTLPTGLDPFGRTTGFGDMAYVGLVGPKHLPKLAGGKLILAAGPTFIFPSASETILGQGKWQAGPSVAVGLITEHWRLGVFPQQWWSFAGDSRRQSVSQMNLQYFLYYAPTPDWEIGIAPNMFVNWNASGGNQVTFPIGLGVHHIFNIGQVPVSVGIEVDYSVIHPEDWPGSRWDVRIYLMPVAPAPWGNLARELRALQQ
jgi:hypothetical protein